MGARNTLLTRPALCARCALLDVRDVPFMGCKMRHYEPSGHHVGTHSASGESSCMAEQAVPGQIGHNEEICAIVTM